jgi:proline iminopeptidase
MDAAGAPGVRRLLYYDQRGGGRSPAAPVGWRAHVQDLERVREHLGLEQLTLVGYSWGGLLAQLYATEHPERVAKLALVSPAPARAADRERMRARMAASQKRPEVEAFKQSLDLSDRKNRFALAVAGYFVDPRRALGLTPFLVTQRAEEAAWRSLGDYDLLPRLRELRVPAFVAHGADDPIPIESAREIASALGAEMVEIPRCGHVPYIEGADALFPPLRLFLD